jgi:F-type H+-transporting ATPase subunit delta
MGSKSANRYAKAVLQQATEENLAAVVFEDMQAVAATIEGSKELRSVLKSPVIKLSDKKEALHTIFKAESKSTQNLINVLIDNKRIDVLGDVASSYVALYNDARGVKVAQVTTAVPISSELEKMVHTKVEQITGSKNVTLENKVDTSIIGGFILRIGDLQYNASIANNLNKLKREFTLN